jgi:integrase
MTKHNTNITNSPLFNVRDKSVAIPLAQNTTLCAEGNRSKAANINRDSIAAAIKAKDELVYVLYVVMMITGSRISEALSIAPHHITRNGSFKIVGSKGSGSRLYYDSSIAQRLIDCKFNNIYIFDRLNRFYVYRIFKSCGFMHKFDGNDKFSVTHLHRHLKALDAIEVDEDNDIVTDVLRHKSNKTKIAYEKER